MIGRGTILKENDDNFDVDGVKLCLIGEFLITHSPGGKIRQYRVCETGEIKLMPIRSLWCNRYGFWRGATTIIQERGDETKQKTLYFRYKNNNLEVEIGEDRYANVVKYNWTVKYFWQAFLEWPF